MSVFFFVAQSLQAPNSMFKCTSVSSSVTFNLTFYYRRPSSSSKSMIRHRHSSLWTFGDLSSSVFWKIAQYMMNPISSIAIDDWPSRISRVFLSLHNVVQFNFTGSDTYKMNSSSRNLNEFEKSAFQRSNRWARRKIQTATSPVTTLMRNSLISAKSLTEENQEKVFLLLSSQASGRSRWTQSLARVTGGHASSMRSVGQCLFGRRKSSSLRTLSTLEKEAVISNFVWRNTSDLHRRDVKLVFTSRATTYASSLRSKSLTVSAWRAFPPPSWSFEWILIIPSNMTWHVPEEAAWFARAVTLIFGSAKS